MLESDLIAFEFNWQLHFRFNLWVKCALVRSGQRFEADEFDLALLELRLRVKHFQDEFESFGRFKAFNLCAEFP